MATQGNSSLYHIDAGILKENACVVLVKTEWNAAVVDALEAGCKTIFDQYRIRYQTLLVPGAVELPFAIKRHWERNKDTRQAPDAFIALGCVIKGDTPHFKYVCDSVTQGILQLNLMLPVPTIFGVLTVNNEEQAQERIGGKHGHKGEEAAITALKMINS